MNGPARDRGAVFFVCWSNISWPGIISPRLIASALTNGMDNKLEQLIAEYQSRVRDAVALMYRSGMTMPSSALAWVKANIPPEGVLEGGVKYCKHGAGCEVQFDSREVDFDFGEDGEVNGFDLWRLLQFARNRFPCAGFDSPEQIETSFEAAIASGELDRSGWGLFFVAGAPRMFAADIDSTRPGDNLPSRNRDPVLTLFAHYFEAADLMRENYEKLNKKWKKDGKLSHMNEVQNRIYFYSWIGFLAVTCEGFKNMHMRQLLMNDRPASFKELIPLCDALGKLIKAHWDPLREFRNNVFHLRASPEKIRNFFSKDVDRLSWARELHDTLERFFSDYRIKCEVHYAMNRRRGELNGGRGPGRLASKVYMES